MGSLNFYLLNWAKTFSIVLTKNIPSKLGKNPLNCVFKKIPSQLGSGHAFLSLSEIRVKESHLEMFKFQDFKHDVCELI